MFAMARVEVAGRLAVHGIVRVMHASLWGFADQALISASNFALMVLLARGLGPGAFGMFVLGYTALLLANSVQGALFTQPHNVLGATRSGRDFADYTRSTALLQLIFSLAGGAVIATAGLVVLSRDGADGWLLIAVGFTIVTGQLQEFGRRVFYTQGAYASAFANDVAAYGGQVLFAAALWRSDRLTGPLAVTGIGVASAAGAAIGVWQLRSILLGRVPWPTVRSHWAQNWAFGKWLLGSAVIAWISGQLYPVLTAGFVGVAATGGMRAAQNLTAPTHVLLKGLESMMPSRAARVHERQGNPGLREFMLRIGAPAMLAMGLYCGAIALLAPRLVPLLLGDRYGHYAWIVQVFAVSYMLMLGSTLASIWLRSRGQSYPMFFAYLGSAAIVLTLGIVAVARFGLGGAMVGIVAHGVVLNAVLWWFVSHPPATTRPHPAGDSRP